MTRDKLKAKALEVARTLRRDTDFSGSEAELEKVYADALVAFAEAAVKEEREYLTWLLSNYVSAWEEAAKESPIIAAKVDVIRAHRDQFVEAAVKAEREACARIADQRVWRTSGAPIANDIRARGAKP